MDVKGKYVENLQQCVCSKPNLKEKLLQAFRSSSNTLDEKLKVSKLHVTRAVVNISSRKLLSRVATKGTEAECWRIVAMYEIG